jgi:hypothetical protein
MKRNKLNSVWKEYCFILQEEFEDTKGVIRIRISKKKTYKRTSNDLQNIHIKLKIE